MTSLFLGGIVGVILMKIFLYRREVRKDREFYRTMMTLYDDARKVGAPTNHLDNVLKSVNPSRRK